MDSVDSLTDRELAELIARRLVRIETAIAAGRLLQLVALVDTLAVQVHELDDRLERLEGRAAPESAPR